MCGVEQWAPHLESYYLYRTYCGHARSGTLRSCHPRELRCALVDLLTTKQNKILDIKKSPYCNRWVLFNPASSLPTDWTHCYLTTSNICIDLNTYFLAFIILRPWWYVTVVVANVSWLRLLSSVNWCQLKRSLTVYRSVDRRFTDMHRRIWRHALAYYQPTPCDVWPTSVCWLLSGEIKINIIHNFKRLQCKGSRMLVNNDLPLVLLRVTR